MAINIRGVCLSARVYLISFSSSTNHGQKEESGIKL